MTPPAYVPPSPNPSQLINQQRITVSQYISTIYCVLFMCKIYLKISLIFRTTKFLYRNSGIQFEICFYIQSMIQREYLQRSSSIKMMQETKACFGVRAVTENRNIKGLFDYNFDISKGRPRFNIPNHCKVYRNDLHDQNYFKAGDYRLNQLYTYVCQLDCEGPSNNPTCWLRANSSFQSQSQDKIPYLVIPSKHEDEKDEGYKLALGDIFKLGLTSLILMEIKTPERLESHIHLHGMNTQRLANVYNIQTYRQQLLQPQGQENIKKEKKIKKQKQKRSTAGKRQKKSRKAFVGSPETDDHLIQDQEIQNQSNCVLPTSHQSKKAQQECFKCKICMQNEQSEADPLISPCQCRGSLQMIHFQCLKQWIKVSKIETSNKNGISYYKFKNAVCQICKHPYPTLFKKGEKILNLFEMDTPQTPYMILKFYHPSTNKIQDTEYLIIPGQSQKIITLGRSKENNIVLTNQTISRKHAQIEYKNNQFYLRDAHSSFGTLVQLKKDYKFGRDDQIWVQIGRCLFEFQLAEDREK